VPTSQLKRLSSTLRIFFSPNLDDTANAANDCSTGLTSRHHGAIVVGNVPG
jgi:hypothetical protein